MSISDQLERAQKARGERNYPKAETILMEARELREDILRQLFYLYFSPAYENLSRAEFCLDEIEKLRPSAFNGMEWAMFMLNCKGDARKARRWAEISAERAKSEKSLETLYSAFSLIGLLAAKEGDLPVVRNMLEELQWLARDGRDLPFGDEVPFLEASIEIDPEIHRDTEELAAQVAPRIGDVAFRKRAEKLVKAV